MLYNPAAVELLVFIIAAGLIATLYVWPYWKWFRYLRWKSRAIRYYEMEDRRRRGLCVQCGYDLRGSPDRCPECGTAAARRAAGARRAG